ncbi:hypothetical protein [Catenulispora acidiphila]|uniref:hypothetical protein n=1 Tax=Catenulispora acidiphila TaxID=304895 RepID=UPI0011801254|nr:hypothetical protein [Catenulispora acidiphila]
MGEQPAAEQQAAGEEAQKTTVFAPRIPVPMRQDVEAIQGLTGQSVNEVGVEALTLWMEAKLADETLGAQALAEIEAEQQRLDQRRASIASLVGQRAVTETAPKPDGPDPNRPVGKQRKATSSGETAS